MAGDTNVGTISPQAAAMNEVAAKLSIEGLDYMKMSFKELDHDGSGTLDRLELQDIFKSEYSSSLQSTAKALHNHFDAASNLNSNDNKRPDFNNFPAANYFDKHFRSDGTRYGVSLKDIETVKYLLSSQSMKDVESVRGSEKGWGLAQGVVGAGASGIGVLSIASGGGAVIGVLSLGLGLKNVYDSYKLLFKSDVPTLRTYVGHQRFQVQAW